MQTFQRERCQDVTFGRCSTATDLFRFETCLIESSFRTFPKVAIIAPRDEHVSRTIQAFPQPRNKFFVRIPDLKTR